MCIHVCVCAHACVCMYVCVSVCACVHVLVYMSKSDPQLAVSSPSPE